MDCDCQSWLLKFSPASTLASSICPRRTINFNESQCGILWTNPARSAGVCHNKFREPFSEFRTTERPKNICILGAWPRGAKVDALLTTPLQLRAICMQKKWQNFPRIRIVSPLLMLNLHAAKGARMAFRLGAFFVSLALIKLIS